MAFLKKKENNDKQKSKISLSDVRVFALLMFVAFVVISVLIAQGVMGTKETQKNIEAAKEKYAQNQLAIANLKALQGRSDEYEAQMESYEAMVPETQNLQEIMIEMENRVEKNRCTLNNFQIAGTGDGQTAPQASGLLHETQINMTINGKYGDILQLMKEITDDQEFMRIDHVHLTPQEQDKMTAEIVVVKFSKN